MLLRLRIRIQRCVMGSSVSERWRRAELRRGLAEALTDNLCVLYQCQAARIATMEVTGARLSTAARTIRMKPRLVVRGVVAGAGVLLLTVATPTAAQFKQGLGPDGTRLTPPPTQSQPPPASNSGPYNYGLGPGGKRLTPAPAPSPGPGFTPDTGFGPSTSSGSTGSIGTTNRGTSSPATPSAPPSSAGGLQICNDSGKRAAVALGHSSAPSSW